MLQMCYTVLNGRDGSFKEFTFLNAAWLIELVLYKDLTNDFRVLF